MNIIIGVFTDLDKMILRGLESFYDIKESYIFSWYAAPFTPDSLKEEFPNIKEVYDWHECVFGNYEKYIFYKQCHPLDRPVLLAMAQYEGRILENLKRFGNKTFDDCKRIYHILIRYWNYMLDAAEIDVVIWGVPHVAFDAVIYRLCQVKGIQFVVPNSGPMFESWFFGCDFEKIFLPIKETYDRLLNELGSKPIDTITIEDKYLSSDFEFYSNPVNDKTPSYMSLYHESRKQENSLLRKLYSVVSNVKVLILQLMRELKNSGFSATFTKALDVLASSEASRVTKRRYREAHKELFEEANFDKKYIYFSLHMQPEATTDPLGDVFCNQDLAISMISHYLPDDVLLYVKEHPMQDPEKRYLKMYKDIAQMNNVKLVCSKTDTYELINNAIAVASISGTVFLESVFAGKPALSFGYHALMYCRGVYSIRSNEDCKIAIESVLRGRKPTLKDIKIYYKAISNECIPVTLSEFPHRVEVESGVVMTDDERAKRILDGYIKLIDDGYVR